MGGPRGRGKSAASAMGLMWTRPAVEPVGEGARVVPAVPEFLGMKEWAVSVDAGLDVEPDEDLLEAVVEYLAPMAGAASYGDGRLGVTFTVEAPTAAAATRLGMAAWKRSPVGRARVVRVELIDVAERDAGQGGPGPASEA